MEHCSLAYSAEFSFGIVKSFSFRNEGRFHVIGYVGS